MIQISSIPYYHMQQCIKIKSIKENMVHNRNHFTAANKVSVSLVTFHRTTIIMHYWSSIAVHTGKWSAELMSIFMATQLLFTQQHSCIMFAKQDQHVTYCVVHNQCVNLVQYKQTVPLMYCQDYEIVTDVNVPK